MTQVSRTPSAATDGDADAVVLVPDDETDACTDLLASGDRALVLALGATPREWLADRGHAVDPAFVATYPHPDCVRVVSDLRDPVDLALAVEAFLESSSEADAPAVCVDGVDALVASAGPTRTARFLHVVANRVRAAGGTLHCHGDAALPGLSASQL